MDTKWQQLAVAGLAASVLACGGSGGKLKPLTPSSASQPSTPSAAAAAAAAAAALFFLPGERLSWDVDWRGMHSATASMRVEAEPSRWHVVSETGSAGFLSLFKKVQEKVDSTLDPQRGVPLHSRSETRDGDRWVRADVDFGAQSYRLRLEKHDRPLQEITAPLPQEGRLYSLDALLGMLRGWQAKQGERGKALAIHTGRLYRLTFVFSQTEMLSTKLGARRARRIDGQAQRLSADWQPMPSKKPLRFAVWIGEGAERVPLRLVAQGSSGSIVASITAYAPAAAK